MAILEEEVWVNLTSRNIKYYENKGYEIPRYKNKDGRFAVKVGTKLLVKVENLSEGSNERVTKICDDCGKQMPNHLYAKILNCRKESDGKDRCYSCIRKKLEKNKKLNMEYEESLEYYAKINNLDFLLKEYSEKNNFKPSNIKRSSNEICWWKCIKCTGEFDMSLNSRTSGQNCPYCSGKRTLIGYNDLFTTHLHVAELLVNKERGYELTAGSGKRELFKCTNCGYEKTKTIQKVVDRGFSCPKCSDGISYGEKFMFNMLEQVTDFEIHKIFEWSNNKIYDFYLRSIDCIIETHGRQHYSYTGFFKSLEEEKKNDQLKEHLALMNGINHYIIIDCSESVMSYIKRSILSSKLDLLLDLSKIDWLECHKYATSSLVKIASDYWESGIKSTIEIGKIIGINNNNVRGYLKQGAELGWCDYDAKEVMKQIGKSNGGLNKVEIVQLTKDNELINIWKSGREASNKLDLNPSAITNALKGKSKTCGGFKWMYLEVYEHQLVKTK